MTPGPREPPSEPPAERPAAEERVGPLLVELHRKADGRPLILYREAPGDDEAGGAREASTPAHHGARGDRKTSTPGEHEARGDG